jgi:hypothetical protein
MGAIGAAIAISAAACNNQTGFSGSVGNTPNGPKLPSFEILGTQGTPFTATLSDSRSSWTFQGNTPLAVFLCNNPSNAASLVATKTTSNNNLLSLEIISGNHISDLQSTNAPFGSATVQAAGGIGTISPQASPDLRIFLRGPFDEKYSALVEDIQTGFIINSRAPTLILFDTPNGKVDATFFGNQNFGVFSANMTLNGQVVINVSNGPNLTIRQP